MVIEVLIVPLLKSILVNERELGGEILLVLFSQQAFDRPAVESKKRGHITAIQFKEGFVKEFLVWL